MGQKNIDVRRSLIAMTLVLGLSGQMGLAQEEKQPLSPEAHRYAMEVYTAIEHTTRHYVRPLSRAALTRSALESLCRAAEHDSTLINYHIINRYAVIWKIQHTLQSGISPIDETGSRDDRPLGNDLPRIESEWARAERNDLLMEIVRVRDQLGDLEAIRGSRGIAATLRGMIQGLDPHSDYVSPSDLRRQNNNYNKPSIGLQFEKRSRPGPLIISWVAFRGPARVAGLVPDDLVISIDGASTDEMTAEDGHERLKGVGDSLITLQVTSDGQPDREIRLKRELVEQDEVLGAAHGDARTTEFMLDPQHRIGIVRIHTLSDDAYVELTRAIHMLNQQRMQGMILDLRSCPGGALRAAHNVADSFLEEGIVYHIFMNTGLPGAGLTDRVATRTTRFVDFPLAVLIGPETSGGGELIAAALQDNKRAILFGMRTRGKATVQSLGIDLGNGHNAKLSTGMFLRPNGGNLHRFNDSRPSDVWGVQPDAGYEIHLSRPMRRRLRAWWLERDIRKVDSNEAVRLDRLENDPAVFAALDWLKNKLSEGKPVATFLQESLIPEN